MKFNIGDVIDSRFTVAGLCSDEGGMGEVLFVTDLLNEFSGRLVLKYCREDGDEYIKRFKREVRLMENFKGNSKVVETIFSNTEHTPPYFVMKYYESGDLTKLIDEISADPLKQEEKFNQMIDCIAQLHFDGVFHRDIKPQNFLIHDDGLVVSDFGLGMEPESLSRFTSSSMFWGTRGYLPPEFQNGGFKHADETGDIFMLGKSFYVLLTKQDPTYLMDGAVTPAIFHVINRACELDKTKRYQSLADLKQALKMAYDVIIGRGGGLSETQQLATTIADRIENEAKYSSPQVIEFIAKLLLLDDHDKIDICYNLKPSFFAILPQEKLISHIPDFLKSYTVMAESNKYSFAFAERIASNMKKIFNSQDVPLKVKAQALSIAIDSAGRMQRFAAMDTCTSMIASVNDDELGVLVADVIQRNNFDFLANIEPSRCKCDSIRRQIELLNE
ncbi:protein kinase [uncultured Paraglaciecola sp.]|uniref:protein kinase domain-containing protein n=1 Tax=uncultured Paraglaciecola sp. TaxID=1765024 RepID=UPI0025992A2D|nr:protein kinase [uncultured Paraglaciecola sp.]